MTFDRIFIISLNIIWILLFIKYVYLDHYTKIEKRNIIINNSENFGIKKIEIHYNTIEIPEFIIVDPLGNNIIEYKNKTYIDEKDIINISDNGINNFISLKINTNIVGTYHIKAILKSKYENATVAIRVVDENSGIEIIEF